MSERKCLCKASEGVELNIPESTIEELIKRVVDEAYEKNLVLNDTTYIKRFQLWTVDGKVTTDSEIFSAIHSHPEKIGYLLPVVCLWEEGGEDHLSVVLDTEILENPKSTSFLKLRKIAEQPPNITVDSLLKASGQNPLF